MLQTCQFLSCISYVLVALATSVQLELGRAAEHGVLREHVFMAKRDNVATIHYELMQAKPEKILLTLAHVHLLSIKATPLVVLLQYTVAGPSF